MAICHAATDEGGWPMVEVTLERESGSVAQQAFVRLAERELSRAYRLAGLILGNQHDAEDATQDALIRAWAAASRLNSWDDFQAWFDRILVNVCRDRLRRRRLIRFIPIGVEHDKPSGDEFSRVLAEDELLRAMSVLDADLRTVVVLRFWADLPVDAIAQRIGAPAGTVKSRLNRAMAAMRQAVEPRTGPEPLR
jgi:RNA polymerase sigma-70 factor (ECF subfamily)